MQWHAEINSRNRANSRNLGTSMEAISLTAWNFYIESDFLCFFTLWKTYYIFMRVDQITLTFKTKKIVNLSSCFGGTFWRVQCNQVLFSCPMALWDGYEYILLQYFQSWFSSIQVKSYLFFLLDYKWYATSFRPLTVDGLTSWSIYILISVELCETTPCVFILLSKCFIKDHHQYPFGWRIHWGLRRRWFESSFSWM